MWVLTHPQARRAATDSLKGVMLMDELIQFVGLLIVLAMVLYLTR